MNTSSLLGLCLIAALLGLKKFRPKTPAAILGLAIAVIIAAIAYDEYKSRLTIEEIEADSQEKVQEGIYKLISAKMNSDKFKLTVISPQEKEKYLKYWMKLTSYENIKVSKISQDKNEYFTSDQIAATEVIFFPFDVAPEKRAEVLKLKDRAKLIVMFNWKYDPSLEELTRSERFLVLECRDDIPTVFDYYPNAQAALAARLNLVSQDHPAAVAAWKSRPRSLSEPSEPQNSEAAAP